MRRGFVGVIAAALVACTGPATQDLGSAKVQVRASAESWAGSGSTDVTLTISSGGSTVSSSALAFNAPHSWTGSFDRLPVGVYRFCATAVDGSFTFGPACADVTISKDHMADVTLVLQQASGQTTVITNSPLIRGLVLSDGAPYYGEPITMTVFASDPSARHALHYAWAASCDGTGTVGSLADATLQTATLTSDCHGTEKISITVTDADQGISSVVEFGVVYSAQGANVGVTLNRWPDITSITSPDAQVEPGERTSVTVLASDVDDAALTYAWSADCGAPGDIFSAPDMPTTGFLAPAASSKAPPYDCTVSVKVSDGKGGSATGSIIIHVGVVSLPVAVFDSIPDVLPPNLASEAFQATQTAEFGEAVTLAAGTGRNATKATVVMSNWAPRSMYPAYPQGDATGFTHPITLNIYAASTDGVHPGALLESVTQDQHIFWRPEATPELCGGDTGAWRASDGQCYHGALTAISFDLTGTTLPDSFVYGIAFNTQSWGATPYGVDGPYTSLNFAIVDAPPSIGTAGTVFWNTHTAAWYFDHGAAGVDVFRADVGGWSGQLPAAEFFAY